MIHPFLSRSLPIVFDDFVDMEFGTGEQEAILGGEKEAMKLTTVIHLPSQSKTNKLFLNQQDLGWVSGHGTRYMRNKGGLGATSSSRGGLCVERDFTESLVPGPCVPQVR